MDKLPSVNSVWTLYSAEGAHKEYAFEHEEDPEFIARVLILAVDEEESIWTCMVLKAHPRLTWDEHQIVMVTFDENDNWSEWKPDLKNYDL